MNSETKHILFQFNSQEYCSIINELSRNRTPLLSEKHANWQKKYYNKLLHRAFIEKFDAFFRSKFLIIVAMRKCDNDLNKSYL